MIEIVGVVLAALLASPLLKKAKHCIWVKMASGAWVCQNKDGNPLRNCHKAVKVMVEHGVPALSIEILPKGVLPI